MHGTFPQVRLRGTLTTIHLVIPAKAGTACLSDNVLTQQDVGSRVPLRDCVCRVVNANAEGDAQRERHGWREQYRDDEQNQAFPGVLPQL